MNTILRVLLLSILCFSIAIAGPDQPWNEDDYGFSGDISILTLLISAICLFGLLFLGGYALGLAIFIILATALYKAFGLIGLGFAIGIAIWFLKQIKTQE
jgi:ABC-type antimicrobial peptide transport system permease subunit